MKVSQVFLLCFAGQRALDNLLAYLGMASELTSDFSGSHASGSQYQQLYLEKKGWFKFF